MSDQHLVPDEELDFDEDLVFSHDGELFTGVAYEDSAAIGRSEVSYRDGMQEGPARDWYPTGVLKGESWYVQGVLHGIATEYDESGRIAEESVYAYGIRLTRRVIGESGAVLREERLDPRGEAGQLLERLRQERRWKEGPGD